MFVKIVPLSFLFIRIIDQKNFILQIRNKKNSGIAKMRFDLLAKKIGWKTEA